MNATQLLAHFDRLAEAPNAVPRLRRFILDLAVRGKLVEQDAGEEPAIELLRKIGVAKERRVREGSLREQNVYLPVDVNDSESELPHGWKWARMSEVVKLWNGFAFKSGDFIPSGVPVIRIGDLQNGEITLAVAVCVTDLVAASVGNEVWIPEDALLIAMSGATTGKVAVNNTGRRVLLNQRVGRIEVFLANRDFVRFFFETIIAKNLSISFGTAIPNLSAKQLNETVIALPPLAEQHRIVAKVDELMALCDQLEAAQQERERRRDRLAASSLQRLNQPALDTTPETQREHARFHLQNLPRLTTRSEHVNAMRQAFLNLAVCGKLISQNSNDEPVARLLKRLGGQAVKDEIGIGLQVIPPSWQWIAVDQIANVSSGTTPSRDVGEYYLPDGIPWVTSGETSNSFITQTAQHVSERAMKETSLKLYPPGTLIVAMYGQGKTRGQITELCISATTNQACAAIVLKLEDGGHRRYVKLFFQKIYEEIRELAAGGAQPNLNGGKIKSTLIPLPPLAEQHRIVAKVDELMALCDQLEAQLTTTQTDSRRLLKAVLDAALSPA